MSLPKKTSSKITVEGLDYRWTVSGQELSAGNYRHKLIVESLAGKRRRIYASSLCSIDLSGDFETVITPRTVAAVIKHALRTGWNPSKSDQHFQIENFELFVGPLEPSPWFVKELLPGAICSIKNADGTFGLVKVLGYGQGVYCRVFNYQFTKRPTSTDVPTPIVDNGFSPDDCYYIDTLFTLREAQHIRTDCVEDDEMDHLERKVSEFYKYGHGLGDRIYGSRVLNDATEPPQAKPQ